MIADDGRPQLSLRARVIVAVEDMNDHSPEFDQKFYKAQIPANTKLDEKIYQVRVSAHCKADSIL